MRENLVKIIVLVFSILLMFTTSKYTNSIVTKEEYQREIVDLETLNDIKDLIENAIQEEYVREYIIDKIKINKIFRCYVGNYKKVQLKDIEKQYSIIYKELPDNSLDEKKLYSQSMNLALAEIYFYIDEELNVTVRCEDRNKNIGICKRLNKEAKV